MKRSDDYSNAARLVKEHYLRVLDELAEKILETEGQSDQITGEDIGNILETYATKLWQITTCLEQLRHVASPRSSDNLGEEERIAREQAQRLKLDFVSLQDIKIPDAVLAMVSRSIVSTYNILPLVESDDELFVIVGNPAEPNILTTLQRVLNRKIRLCVAPASQIKAHIRRYYG